jgi:hypothetical protein
MIERLAMDVRVLIGLGVALVSSGVMIFGLLDGRVAGVVLLALGIFCLLAAVIRRRRRAPPPPHSIHEELHEAWAARTLAGAIVTAVFWAAAIVALFRAGFHVIGAVLLAMAVIGPLLAFYLATSATRTHRRRRSGSSPRVG